MILRVEVPLPSGSSSSCLDVSEPGSVSHRPLPPAQGCIPGLRGQASKAHPHVPCLLRLTQSCRLSADHLFCLWKNTPEEVMLCFFPGSLLWLLTPVTLWLVLPIPLSFPFPEALAGVEPSFPTCWRLDRLLRCLGLSLWSPKTSGTSSHPPCWCQLLSPGWKSISTWI